MPLSVQVNIPAESGEMGVLANHVPSIEQLKPGLVEIIEESGGSKQFFCMFMSKSGIETSLAECLLTGAGRTHTQKDTNCACVSSVWRICNCAARFSA